MFLSDKLYFTDFCVSSRNKYDTIEYYYKNYLYRLLSKGFRLEKKILLNIDKHTRI